MMKKFVIFIFLFLIFSFKSYGAQDGRGELQLSEQAVNQFISYIKGDINKGKSLINKPLTLWMSHDGNYAYWWYCPYSSCSPGNGNIERRQCENGSKQSCSRFARGRYVRWDNGINPKGKAAKFTSKMSENEIRSKLTKLGFYENNLSTNTEINESNDAIISKDKNLVEQLEALNQMYQDGLINEEEFKDAKKKILN
jgi:hypothetical protein